MGIVATLAFSLWPVVTLFLYRSLPAGRATLWNFLAAQMLLPTGFIKFDMIPPFDKASIPTFCALIGCWLYSRKTVRFGTGLGVAELLLLMYCVAPIASAMSNTDSIVANDRFLPGVGLYDGLSSVEQAIVAILPFVFGRWLYRTVDDYADILRILIVSGLVYSLPMLFEIRFSPQLHFWIYGFYSSDFIQTARGDGFRPLVFMGHGLLASFFMMTTSVAAAAFWRSGTRLLGFSAGLLTGFLGLVLVLCKSLGATIYGVTAIPLIRWASPKFISRTALLLTVLALCYPLLRAEGWFPTELVVSAARTISDERSRSIEFRFANEDLLLAHASGRPLFGWGRFGRSRVYDSESGSDISVTDGRWIIMLGQYGFLGFLAEFGLLALGVFKVSAVLKYVPSFRERLFLSTIALIVALNILDLLPNATLTPFSFLLAGALTGCTEATRANAKRRSRTSMRLSTDAIPVAR
jgi:hypothetical protein